MQQVSAYLKVHKSCLTIKYGRTENLLALVTKYTIWDFVDWID